MDPRTEGFGWVLEATFLARLDRKARAWVLERMSLRDFRSGEPILGPGDRRPGLFLLVLGQATVWRIHGAGGVGQRGHASEEVVCDLRPGRVIGEGIRMRHGDSIRVTAGTDCRALYLSGEDLAEATEKFSSFREGVESQARLLRQWDGLMDLVSRNRFLRVLGRDETERLLESGEVMRVSRGDVLIRAGKPATRLMLVVRGRVKVAPSGSGFQAVVLERGQTIGEAPVLLERQSEADVVALEPGLILTWPAPVFRECVARNPVVQWQVLQAIGSREVAIAAEVRQPAGSLVCVLGYDREIGESTVAYGLAECLRTSSPLEDPLDVALVDLQGEKTARKLGFSPGREPVHGVLVRTLPPREGFPLRVVWPENTADTRALVQSMMTTGGGGGPHRVVVLSGVRRGEVGADALGDPSVVVTVRAAGAPMPLGTLRHEHFRVQAVRIVPGQSQPLALSRKTVRLPHDPAGVARFWSTGRLEEVSSPARPLGRAMARLARLVRGSSVGLALGGGGAFGFAHVGLLRALEEAHLPVDFVAGVSFGSVVGALYVGGGMRALDRLERDGALLEGMAVWKAPVSTQCIGDYVDGVAGGLHLEETEVPFYPVGLDLAAGQEFVLSDGTLGLAVRSASSMPGLWPTLAWKGRRVVDGGLVNNVPVSTLWEAGADFLLASNCLPPNPMVGRSPSARFLDTFVREKVGWIFRFDWLLGRTRTWFQGASDRLDDGVRALYNVFSQNGRDRSLMADHVFEAPGRDFDAYAFRRGEEIARAAYEVAREEVPAILDSYRQDVSRRF